MALRQLICRGIPKLAHQERSVLCRQSSTKILTTLDGDVEENALVLGDQKRNEYLDKLKTTEVVVDEPNHLSTISGVPEEHVFNRRVRIYRPAKNAMQSGTYDTLKWKLDFENRQRWENPLMGWTSTGDPNSNLHMWFDSKEDAMAYCEKYGFQYQVEDYIPRRNLHKSYAANFAWNKRTRIGSK